MERCSMVLVSSVVAVVLSCLQAAQGSYGPLFMPENCDRATWLRYNGCSKDNWAHNVDRCNLLKSLLVKKGFMIQDKAESPEEESDGDFQPPPGGDLDVSGDEWSMDEEIDEDKPLGNGTSREDEGEGEGPPGACIAEDEMLDSEQVEAMISKTLEEIENMEEEQSQGEAGQRRSRRKKKKVPTATLR